MEILLTDEEMEQSRNAGQDAWGNGGCHGDMGDWMNLYLCRAQVRKVAEWMKKHGYWNTCVAGIKEPTSAIPQSRIQELHTAMDVPGDDEPVPGEMVDGCEYDIVEPEAAGGEG